MVLNIKIRLKFRVKVMEKGLFGVKIEVNTCLKVVFSVILCRRNN